MTVTPRTPTTEATAASAPTPATTEQAASYQRLRAHLGYLRLPTAAQVLPEVLDAARTEQLSPTALSDMRAGRAGATLARLDGYVLRSKRP